MKQLLTMILFVFALLPLVGCAQDDVKQAPIIKENIPEQDESLLVRCQSPRPDMCAMNYKPVIGLDKEGKKAKYSNACRACSNKNVIGYYPSVE